MIQNWPLARDWCAQEAIKSIAIAKLIRAAVGAVCAVTGWVWVWWIDPMALPVSNAYAL